MYVANAVKKVPYKLVPLDNDGDIYGSSGRVAAIGFTLRSPGGRVYWGHRRYGGSTILALFQFPVTKNDYQKRVYM